MKILAFPGMGKTALALSNPKYLDLDFGHFRESLGVAKLDEQRLIPAFARLMEMYERDGYIVLSNDPKLLQRTHIDRVYVPTTIKFARRKLHVSKDTIKLWIDDWVDSALKANVPVIPLSTGLDKYLK